MTHIDLMSSKNLSVEPQGRRMSLHTHERQGRRPLHPHKHRVHRDRVKRRPRIHPRPSRLSELVGVSRIRKWLRGQGITFIQGYSIPQLPQEKYSFYLPDTNVLITYDDSHHFERHKTVSAFKEYQRADRLKTLRALSNGYKLVRLDYTTAGNIENELEEALSSNNHLYLSSDIYET